VGKRYNREAIVTAIVVSATHEEAAAAVGCTPRSIRRWLSRPAFRQDVKSARAEALAGILSRVLRLRVRAIGILEDALTPKTNETPVLTPAEQVEVALKIHKEMDVDWSDMRAAELAAESSREMSERLADFRRAYRKKEQRDSRGPTKRQKKPPVPGRNGTTTAD
jgi:hypothetical protein